MLSSSCNHNVPCSTQVLHVVDLSGTKEVVMPGTISALTGLQELWYNGCYMPGDVPAALAALVGLTRLDLSGCTLPAWPEVVQQLGGLGHLLMASVRGLPEQLPEQLFQPLSGLVLMSLRDTGECWPASPLGWI
jgi:hypothetical protein